MFKVTLLKLKNCTSNVELNKTYQNGYEVIIRSKEGYYFNRTPVCMLNSKSLSFELDDNKLVAKLIIRSSGQLMINCSSVLDDRPSKFYKFDKVDIENCTSDFNFNDYLSVGINQRINLTVDDGFTFENSKPYLIINGRKALFTIESDFKKAWYDLHLDTIPMILEGYMKATEDIPKNTYKFKQIDLYNCTSNINVDEVYNYNTPIDVECICNDGFVFESEPYISYYSGGSYISYLYLTISEDRKTATGTFNNQSVLRLPPSLYATGVSDEPDNTPFLNIYECDNKSLIELNKKRFEDEDNITNFIMSLKTVYCNGLNVTDSTIYTGGKNLGIKCKEVNKENVSYTFKDVNFKYEVITPIKTDYDSVIDLYIPLCDVISIDPINVINKDIEIEYVINMVTSSGIVNLKNDGEVFKTVEINDFGFDIPYITNNYKNSSTIYNHNNKIHIEKPYLHIVSDHVVSINNEVNNYDNGTVSDMFDKYDYIQGDFSLDKLNTVSEIKNRISYLFKTGIYK